MNEESKACFKTAVDEIFNRWTGLKLAVEHMGGRNGQQVIQLLEKYFIHLIYIQLLLC